MPSGPAEGQSKKTATADCSRLSSARRLLSDGDSLNCNDKVRVQVTTHEPGTDQRTHYPAVVRGSPEMCRRPSTCKLGIQQPYRRMVEMGRTMISR